MQVPMSLFIMLPAVSNFFRNNNKKNELKLMIFVFFIVTLVFFYSVYFIKNVIITYKCHYNHFQVEFSDRT